MDVGILGNRNAYNMVLHKFGEKLYSGLVTTMTMHLREISKSIEDAQGGSFIEELNRKWADHNKALQMIWDILMYMDRTFIPSEIIDRWLVRNVIMMLMDLSSVVYQEDFEKHFLNVSANFYSVESQQFIECCDCGDYLMKAERRLNEKMERVSHYLDPSSEAKITNVVEKEMIANRMHRIVHMENSGLVNMLVDDKYEDLGRMYSLFRRVPDGLSFIRDYFINLNPCSPEFISLFVDEKLRKGLKGYFEEDVEVVLDKVMMLFRYLQEKDVFEKYYKQHLAKRLLSKTSFVSMML
ncbi:hypothetical protein Sjap_003960 [Stephania japonica]|uniref:Cullin family profile domain-containing protein n=1 Tax=Stephania japonica TaxID=461633 RepID=A0AAP0K1D5_9MAGN